MKGKLIEWQSQTGYGGYKFEKKEGHVLDKVLTCDDVRIKNSVASGHGGVVYTDQVFIKHRDMYLVEEHTTNKIMLVDPASITKIIESNNDDYEG